MSLSPIIDTWCGATDLNIGWAAPIVQEYGWMDIPASYLLISTAVPMHSETTVKV